MSQLSFLRMLQKILLNGSECLRNQRLRELAAVLALCSPVTGQDLPQPVSPDVSKPLPQIQRIESPKDFIEAFKEASKRMSKSDWEAVRKAQEDAIDPAGAKKKAPLPDPGREQVPGALADAEAAANSLRMMREWYSLKPGGALPNMVPGPPQIPASAYLAELRGLESKVARLEEEVTLLKKANEQKQEIITLQEQFIVDLKKQIEVPAKENQP